MNQLKLYVQTCEKIDAILAEMDPEYGSLEGLNSSLIGRMFVSICDTFSGLLKTAASNLVNCTKSIKRSEINEFVQSNSMKMRTVDNIPYEKRIDVDVDIPANMKGTYKAAVNALVQVYTKLSAMNSVKLADTSFRETLLALMQSSKDVDKQIESTCTIFTRIGKQALPAINLALAQFNGKFSYKKAYQDVFLTNQEWVEVRKTLIENESRLQDVRQIGSMIESMEGTLREIAKQAESVDTVLTQKDLKNLGETAKQVALIVDAYGMAATRQMTIEHNYVLTANHLYDTCK